MGVCDNNFVKYLSFARGYVTLSYLWRRESSSLYKVFVKCFLLGENLDGIKVSHRLFIAVFFLLDSGLGETI